MLIAVIKTALPAHNATADRALVPFDCYCTSLTTPIDAGTPVTASEWGDWLTQTWVTLSLELPTTAGSREDELPQPLSVAATIRKIDAAMTVT